MPLGSRHHETGLLLREGEWLILQRDDGGRWRLDIHRRAERFLGLRIEVEGVRSGFDVLSVRRFGTPAAQMRQDPSQGY